MLWKPSSLLLTISRPRLIFAYARLLKVVIGVKVITINKQVTEINDGTNITYDQEVLRKVIHFCSLIMPLAYAFVELKWILSIIVPITLLSMILDLASKKNKHLKWLRDKLFGKMLRPHERENKFTFNGATWVFIAASLTFIIFPKVIAVTAFSILIISDVAAALIGRKYGRIKIFETKSVEGTMAFIVSAGIVVSLYALLFGAPLSFYYVGFVAAFVGGIVEAASKKLKIDDNLTIPMSIGTVMWLGGLIADNAGQSFLNIAVNEKVQFVVDSLKTINFN